MLVIKPKYFILAIEDGSNNAGEITVQEGDLVYKNQVLTKTLDDNNTPLHSPCNGIVTKISYMPHLYIKELDILNITIEEKKELNLDINTNSKTGNVISIEALQSSGIIGLGGAGFPSFKKIINNNIDTLIINAVECEPPLSADEALMSDPQNGHKILKGINILREIIAKNNSNNNFKSIKIIIAIEANKTKSYNLLKKLIKKLALDFQLKKIAPLYPNGDAKYIINSILNKKIPKHIHSVEHGIVVFNVATVFSIHEYFILGEPLTSRIVTLSGTALKDKYNAILPIGTPISEILSHFNLLNETQNLTIKMGGYYMGVDVVNLNGGLLKTTNSLIINYKKSKKESLPCINCTNCNSICPQNLIPQQLYKFSKNMDHDGLNSYYATQCIECGLCDTVCPSSINITDYIKYGKNLLRNTTNNLNNAEILEKRYTYFQNKKTEKLLQHESKVKKQSTLDKKSLLLATLNKIKSKN